jgi:membrane protease YdiL (CAAX protease family)
MKNPIASPIAGTISVVAAYMLVRSAIYFLLPANSLETWFIRDAIMSVPRLAAFGALLILNRTWHSSAFDWQLKDFGRALLYGGLLVAMFIFYHSGSVGPKFPSSMVAALLFTTVPVALFEEYAFRGPLLTGLCQRSSPLMGILLTSGIFAVFHLQAQPLSHWGRIFLIGVILANLRVKGLSLGWLAATHFLLDIVWIFYRSRTPTMTSFHGVAYQIALLLYALASFPYRQERMRVKAVSGIPQ